MRAKTDRRKETMLKIPQFSPKKVAFAHRFFPAHCDLIHKSGTLRKRTRSDTMCNSRIAKIFPGLAGISIGKTAFQQGITLRWHLFVGPYLLDPSSPPHKSKTLRKRVSQAFQGHQDHRKTTLGATSTVCAKTDENKENVPKI